MPAAVPWIMLGTSAYTAYEAHEAREDAKKELKKQQEELERQQAEMERKAEAEKERKRREDALRFGLTKTIATSSFGDATTATLQKKTLLGQ